MAAIIDQDQEELYEIEPRISSQTLPEQEQKTDPPEEYIDRRVYYIRGRKGRERVIATIRARNRNRAIEIAVSTGIMVDPKEFAND
ncbi:MAG: hypothetical protein O7G85_14710 [Planctomycetota bacterium]|nr:hypothetical protein [Planctomycetota bacterium]